MSGTGTEALPDASRVWVFAADRRPTPGEAAHLVERMTEFVAEWAAHRRDLRAALDWRYGRFLVIAVDESRTGASGCSIDALVHRLTELEEALDLSLVDGSPVWFRDGSREGEIRCVDRSEFRRLFREGQVDHDTVVFDLTVDRLGDLREGAWERPARETWHARLLADPAPARDTE